MNFCNSKVELFDFEKDSLIIIIFSFYKLIHENGIYFFIYY